MKEEGGFAPETVRLTTSPSPTYTAQWLYSTFSISTMSPGLGSYRGPTTGDLVKTYRGHVTDLEEPYKGHKADLEETYRRCVTD